MQTALTLIRAPSRGRLALRSAGGAVNPRELETVPQSWRRVGPRSVVAHVLDDDFTLYVALFAAASVLIGPLQLEDAALVEVHLTLRGSGQAAVVLGAARVEAAGALANGVTSVADLIAAGVVVLRVEETVVVLDVVVLLVELVVGASRVVEVDVSEQQRRGEGEHHPTRTGRMGVTPKRILKGTGLFLEHTGTTRARTRTRQKENTRVRELSSGSRRSWLLPI